MGSFVIHNICYIYIHYSKPVTVTTSPDKRYMLKGIWKKNPESLDLINALVTDFHHIVTFVNYVTVNYVTLFYDITLMNFPLVNLNSLCLHSIH